MKSSQEVPQEKCENGLDPRKMNYKCNDAMISVIDEALQNFKGDINQAI